MRDLALQRMSRRAALACAAGWAAGRALSVHAQAPAPTPPAALTQPAVLTPKALGAAMLAVTRAGQRLVAVGARGTVLLSDDHGARWRQARVPLQASLTCVRFASERLGWAAGHLGVVLHSADGGETWHTQLDGVAAASLAFQAAQRLGSEAAIHKAQRLVDEGPDKPFFDLTFTDARRGLAVGAYGQVFATEDGGASWTPRMDRLPNPKSLHLYGVQARGNTLVVAGEQGLLLRSTDGGANFAAIPSPYQGSFFGLLRTESGAWVAYGLRGTAYRSANDGQAWTRLDTGLHTSLSTGVPLPDAGFALVSQSGDVLLARNDTGPLRRLATREPVPVCGATVAADGSLVLASLRGMRRLPDPLAA